MSSENKHKEKIGSSSNSNSTYELTNRQKRYLPIKRALDIVLAGTASVILSPVIGIE